MTTDKKPDKDPPNAWSKADVLIKALVPITVLLVGHCFTQQQQEAARGSQRIERLSALVEPLASDNARERKLAIEVAGYLAGVGELPPELVPTLVSIAKEDPSADTARAASAALARVEQSNPALKPEIEQSLAALPARVYVHVASDAQRDPARRLSSKLVEALGSGFVVPGIEKRRGPARTELRFFRAGERDEAERIVAALRELDVRAALTDLSARFENAPGIRPRHFELWLGDDYPAAPG